MKEKSNSAPKPQLRSRLFVAFAVILAILVGAVSWIPVAKLRSLLLESEVQKVRIVAKQLAHVCEDLYMSPSDQQLRTKLANAMRDFPDISYVLHKDRNDTLLWQGRNRSVDSLKERIARIDPSQKTNEYVRAHDETYIDIGEMTLTQPRLPVHVGFPRSVLADQIRAFVWHQIAIALVVLAAGLVVAFLLSSWLTRPVVELASLAEKISLGDMNVRLNLKSRGEIGKVCHSLERLKESVLYALRRLDNTQRPTEEMTKNETPQKETLAKGERRWPSLR